MATFEQINIDTLFPERCMYCARIVMYLDDF